MTMEDQPPDSADDLPIEDALTLSPPDRLEPPLEADEADVLDQVLEVPPPDDDV
jgi:hypothetical protein